MVSKLPSIRKSEVLSLVPTGIESSALSVVIVPAVTASLLFFVFTYLYRQSRQQYLRAWQLAWAVYTVREVFTAWSAARTPLPWIPLANALLLGGMVLCIFISTRLIRERFRPHWKDFAIALAAVAVALWNEGAPFIPGLSPVSPPLGQSAPRDRSRRIAALLLVLLLPRGPPQEFAGLFIALACPGSVGRRAGRGANTKHLHPDVCRRRTNVIGDFHGYGAL